MESIINCQNTSYPVVTMGTFDGVHKGHQKLFQTVIEKASLRKNGKSVVITYFHHPKEVLGKPLTPYLLTEKESKETLIKSSGIDEVIYLEFDRQMSMLSAEVFLRDILIERFRTKEMVFGYDCHFGHNREGDYHLLEEKRETFGYLPHLIEPVRIDNRIVSSSLIRDMVKAGQVEEITGYLGRRYDLHGVVVPGLGVGRMLGFPTINIEPSDHLKLLPGTGVYYALTHIGDDTFCSLTNVGNAPTVKNSEHTQVECHLLGFSGELYGKKVRVEFIKRIRDEVRFSNRNELKSALEKDRQFVKGICLYDTEPTKNINPKYR